MAIHLEALRQDEEAVVGAQEMNLKFATSSDVFEAMFGKFREFLGGVAEQVGLPPSSYEPLFPCGFGLSWGGALDRQLEEVPFDDPSRSDDP